MPNARLFSSTLAPNLQAYVDLKRALGRRFDAVTHTLVSLDRFLKSGKYKTLSSAAFEGWCRTHDGVASGVRRARMLGCAQLLPCTAAAPNPTVLSRM